MPFTDPMADGPAIQAAGLRALRAGMNLQGVLALVAAFPQGRRRDADRADGLLQSDLCLWRRTFLADAKAAGVDGMIVVDLPPEEDEELCLPALRAGLNFIRLATPTTDDARLPAVLANTSGFVYYVSITGITGAAPAGLLKGRQRGGADQAAYVPAGRGRLRRQERRRRRRDRRSADAVVVGSALIDALGRHARRAGPRRRGGGWRGQRLVGELARGVATRGSKKR